MEGLTGTWTYQVRSLVYLLRVPALNHYLRHRFSIAMFGELTSLQKIAVHREQQRGPATCVFLA